MTRLPWLSIAIILSLVFMAVFAPVISPHDPIDQSLFKKLLPPVWEERGTWEHILGTDKFGRDVMSRLFYGARISLVVTLFALTVGGGIGLLIGIVSGFVGGWVDSVLMRLVGFACVGGFLFGYDTGVTSGALVFLKDQWLLGNLFH